jgi:hypothetical protein
MEKIALQSLGHTRADKKGRRRWPLFLRAACTNPSITNPHSSSITHPTRPRLRTWPVVDFPPDPSSIADPTRPRLPNRPVLDPPFDPSLIYRTDRSTITDSTRDFTLPEFSRTSISVVAGYVGPVRVSTRASTRVSYALTDGQWSTTKKKSSYTLPGRTLLLLLHMQCPYIGRHVFWKTHEMPWWASFFHSEPL